MNHVVDAIVPVCSYDADIIKHTIKGLKDSVRYIYLPYYEYLLDGSLDDLKFINDIIGETETFQSLFNVPLVYQPDKTARWHHNNARYSAAQLSDADYLLMVDADEVFESPKLKIFTRDVLPNFDVVSFTNYWYFRSPRFQARTYEDSPIAVKKSLVTEELGFDELERAVYKKLKGVKKLIGATHYNGEPMCHHYSWAMDKEKMLKKVSSWGHSGDRDWRALVEEEFSREFNGTDFVHGYNYITLEKAYIEQ